MSLNLSRNFRLFPSPFSPYGAAALVGFGLVLLGIFMPQGWYFNLPFNLELAAPPFPGIWILQSLLVLEGVAILVLVFKKERFNQLQPDQLPFSASPPDQTGDISRERAGKLLLLVTVLALFLRLWQCNTCLWLDELSPLVAYEKSSLLDLLTIYYSTNLHLLNELIIKLLINMFGEQEWVVRLPAIIFGVMTIPIFYWTARQAFTRKVSLCAAFLLAVSYHHIFFSQNARGYTAYIFFTLASSGLLLRAFADDRPRTWLLYIAAMFGNFASLMASGFVLAAHIIITVVAALILKYKNRNPFPFLRHAIGVMLITAVLGIQIYSVVIPQACVVVKSTYKDAMSGYRFASLEFLLEVLRGLSLGLSPLLIATAVVVLLFVAAGVCMTLKRSWTLFLTLALPSFLLIMVLVIGNISGAPRFFIVAIPIAYLAATAALEEISSLLAKHHRILAKATFYCGLGLCMIVSIWPLRTYYRIPKQDYKQAVETIKSIKQPDQVAMVIYYAEVGFIYYARRGQLIENRDYFRVRAADKFDRIVNQYGNRNIYIVTTFPRPLRRDHPELLERIEKSWQVFKKYPGTIGGGDLILWTPKKLVPHAK